MEQENPTSISVILPVYNGLPYLKESVSSVLQQSFADFELLIVDDVSTDGSLAYLESLQDSRIQLFTNDTNRGLFFNLNFLITKSRSPLIKLWSQDDIMYSDCLEKIIRFHSAHPGVGFIYSGRDIINDNGDLVPNEITDTTPEIVLKELHTRIAFFTGSIAGNISNVTLSAKALETTGLFNESMKISGDFEMWVRMAEKFPIGFIHDRLIRLRDHSEQLSRQAKYYVHHLQEDLSVYSFLISYTPEREARKGKIILRNHKLLFYYTLMMKSFLKGSFRTGFYFYKTLGKFDSMLLLSLYFLRNRVFFKRKYAKMHIDNSEFLKQVDPGN
jgi:glycosyltransferase involved in cell wall biosynthesis